MCGFRSSWVPILVVAMTGGAACSGKGSSASADLRCGAIYDRLAAIDASISRLVVKVEYVFGCEVSWYEAERRCFGEATDASDLESCFALGDELRVRDMQGDDSLKAERTAKRERPKADRALRERVAKSWVAIETNERMAALGAGATDEARQQVDESLKGWADDLVRDDSRSYPAALFECYAAAKTSAAWFACTGN